MTRRLARLLAFALLAAAFSSTAPDDATTELCMTDTECGCTDDCLE